MGRFVECLGEDSDSDVGYKCLQHGTREGVRNVEGHPLREQKQRGAECVQPSCVGYLDAQSQTIYPVSIYCEKAVA